MKKFLLLAALSVAFVSTQAQVRTHTVANIQQGQYIDLGGNTTSPTDSLQVTDSVAYIIPITHNNDVNVFNSFYWLKSGSGTATVTVNFFQANDPTNFLPIKAGLAQSNYTKTFTLASTQWNDISFARDTARFEGRYLKVQFITSSTASVKGYVFNRLKTYVK